MRHRHLVIIPAAMLLMLFSTAAFAFAGLGDTDDTDIKMVDAKVTEVTDARISVIAQTGVEHVIAVNRTDTKVTLNGRVVSLKDLREGDVVTIELDAEKQVKFARVISMRSDQGEVARVRQ
jgi:LEA14-like dessication related protein